MATLKTQGTELYILDDTDTGNEVCKIGQVTSFDLNDSDDPQIESTNFDSVRRQFLVGLPGEMTSSVGFDYDPQDGGHDKLRVARESGSTLRVLIAFSESTTQPTYDAGFTIPTDRSTVEIPAARVTSLDLSFGADDIVRGTTGFAFSERTLTKAA